MTDNLTDNLQHWRALAHTITELNIENVKRLRAVHITPDGSPLVVIGGDNAQGKSSVLDAIQYALGGKGTICEQPVRMGEDRAEVVCRLNGLVVRRTFTATGATALKVTSDDGASYGSPQTVLDALVGQLAFDPLEFTRQKPAVQLEALQRLIGLDVSRFAKERDEAYSKRTEVNRTVKQYEVWLGSKPGVPDGVPDEEQQVGDVATELRTATETLSRHQTALAAADDMSRRIKAETAAIAQIEEQLAKRKEALARGIEKHEITQRELAAAGENLPCIEAIQEKLQTIEETNRLVRHKRTVKDYTARLAAARAESARLTSRLDEIDNERRKVVQEQQYPVPGLSVSDTCVTLEGVPLQQCSAAEQLKVSVAVGLASNPKLRVMLVRDGSLLDSGNLQLLADMAAAAGAQIWVERVGQGAESTVIIEDGTVRQTEEEQLRVTSAQTGLPLEDAAQIMTLGTATTVRLAAK